MLTPPAGQIGPVHLLHDPASLSERVPGAGLQAIVAAEDAMAYGRSKRFGNGAFQLNGEVGDATP